jgi:ribosomal protein S4E
LGFAETKRKKKKIIKLGDEGIDKAVRNLPLPVGFLDLRNLRVLN